jgi:chemotaxis protein methyltransferase CheR
LVAAGFGPREEGKTIVTIAVRDFEYIRDFLVKRSAILLDQEKQYLVETRLQPLAIREGFTTIGELIAKMRTTPVNGLHQRVVEAMTTNETSFFRDVNPFNALRKTLLPELIAARETTRSLRIWSMACSTGQEPYSVAMLLREHFPRLASWKVHIFATDLATQVVERARAGTYNQHEISRGLPSTYLVKYFDRIENNWRVKAEIRQMIEFQQLNLIELWPVMPPFDIVLLRNVLIYFDVAVKKEILARVRRILRPDGYLLLGGAENVLGLDDAFRRIEVEQTSIYGMIREE